MSFTSDDSYGKEIEVRGLDSKKSWDYENGFYWFGHPTRISKLLSHFEIYKKIIEVPGDILELGVYKGTSLIRFATFRSLLENDFSRKIVGFDSFGKFPSSLKNIESDQDFIDDFEEAGGNGLELEELQRILANKNFDNIELVKGDVFDTLNEYLARKPHTRISLLHMDLDVFAPTEYSLNLLYDRVVPGGLIVFDDYSSVEGESIAVDNFIKTHNLSITKSKYYSVPSYVIKQLDK